MNTSQDGKWIVEYTHGEHSAHIFQVQDHIAYDKTKYQSVDIVKLHHYGKSLFLDAKLQTSEHDEFIYHECLVHPAMLAHPNPKHVLIIGGADGCTLREVLKHRCVERVTMVEIDEQATELCRRYLPELHRNSFEDSKVDLVFAEGRQYIEQSEETYDVIFGDLTAPMVEPPSYLLFTQEFFTLIKHKLKEGGILSIQADSTNCCACDVFTLINHTLETVFPVVRALDAFIPSYDNAWGFILASTNIDPASIPAHEIDKRMQARSIDGLRYYHSLLHASLFVLPTYLKDALCNEDRVISDDNPVISKI